MGCPDLRCADPEAYLPASDEEQVMMVVEVGLVAAMLDHRLPRSESDALVQSIRLLPGLRNLTDTQVNMLLTQAGERTIRGDAWLCDVAHRLVHRGLRRVAFRMAALFCAWDGLIDEKEREYLNWLAGTFEFSDEEAQRMFDEATGQATPEPPPSAVVCEE